MNVPQLTDIAERALLPAATSPLAGLCETVNLQLDALTQPAGANSQLLDVAIRRVLLAPAKRIRPLLMLLTARHLGLDTACVLDAACALEMLHTASLILDDLPCMDDAVSRRGQPATHIVFGQDVAILAAVSLLCRGFAVVARSVTLPVVCRPAIVAILADAAGHCGLSAGQMNDLQSVTDGRTEAQREQIDHLKTGVLFVAGVDIPLALSDADDLPKSGLREFARLFGLAFQLRDDLEDMEHKASGDGTGGGADPGTPSPAAAAIGRRIVHYRAAMFGCLSSAPPNGLSNASPALPGAHPQRELRLLVDSVFSDQR